MEGDWLIKDEAIILSKNLYGDNQEIINLYTKSHGLIPVIQKIPSKKKNSNYFYKEPFSVLNVVFKNSKTQIKRLTEAEIIHSNFGLHPDKTAVIYFLSEVVNNCLRFEGNPDTQLFDFIKEKIFELNSSNQYADFPIYFLCDFLKHLGLSLESYSEFEFSSDSILKTIKDLNNSNSTDRIRNRNQRKQLINYMLKCLEENIGGFKIPKSLEVLEVYFD